jgi:hypothetical protein
MAAKKPPKKTSTPRIPYYRAPFYFAPEYLATPAEWQETFRRVAESILIKSECGGKIVEVDAYSIKLGWGSLELTIDARLGKFDIWENPKKVDDFRDDWAGLEAEPSSFCDTLELEKIPEHLAPVVLLRVIPFAEAMFRKMTESFEKALREKNAELRAQPISPLPTTPFKRIEPDQRRYFPLVPKERELTLAHADELDEALGPNGERLYSWCVVPLLSCTRFRRHRVRCFMELEVCHGETEVYTGVQA